MSKFLSSQSAFRVLGLFGPTAAGKSELAHLAALALGGEIVVCDPFQRYRGLEIAADAPSARDRAAVRYHMVSDLDLSEGSTAGDFAVVARERVDDVLARGHVPIVAGGTGLYLRLALTDVEMPPPVDEAIRAGVESLVNDDLDGARAELQRLDPERASRVDLANPRRVARALEIARSTPTASPHDELWTAPMRHPTLLVGVTRPMSVLSERIAARVDRELSDGLAAELRALRERGDRHRAVDQIIGVREIAALDSGEMAPGDLPAALAQRTRRLARKQLTWLRKLPGLVQLDLGEESAAESLDVLLAGWRGGSL